MFDRQIFDDLSVAPFPGAIQISSDGLPQFLDLSPDALVIINHTGTIVMVNEQATAFFGFPREGTLGAAH